VAKKNWWESIGTWRREIGRERKEVEIETLFSLGIRRKIAKMRRDYTDIARREESLAPR